MKEKEFYAKALKTWGRDFIVDMLIEECAEIIVAAKHFQRRREGSFTELMEEIADTEIIIENFKIGLLGQIHEFRLIKVRKLKRAMERLAHDG